MPPDAQDPRRAAIIAAARGWIGTPYRHQASLRGVGADCLGLLRGVWRETLGAEPEAPTVYAPGWAEVAANEPLLEAAARHLLLRPDLRPIAASVLVFRWRDGVAAKHCGIATGPNHFIHAHDGAVVAEVALIPSWRRRLVGVFDFPVSLEHE
jgi:NlpC/P60 family putative phage cell wall peptidase